MTRPIRWVVRIGMGFLLLSIVTVAAVFVERDAIARKLLISRVHSATGMETRIDSVRVGLLSPTMTIEGLKLYNTPAFGGALALDMPKLQLEYDRAAAHSGTIHLPVVRLDLAEIDLVTDKEGRSNFSAVEKPGRQLGSHTNSAYRFTFSGIDTLNLALGKFHSSNLRSGTETQVDFGMKAQVFHNVNSGADLKGLGALLNLRGPNSSDGTGIDFNKLFNDFIAR